MVKHNGLCPSLKKKVDFDVSEIVEIPTKRGVKYQVKGTYDGRTCSTFCSKAKAEELKARLGGRTMAAEEDTTGQAHQEEGVSPLRGQVEPLAQGQTSAEALPVQQTVSKPIVGTDVGVEPLQPIEAPNIPESSMETVFDEAPVMDANFEIAEMQPDGDGRSIGNIAPMNPDAPLHAEEFSADEAEIAEDSEMNVGQVQQTADEPAIIGPSELAYGQEQESAEALPVQQTVATSFSPADSQIAPIDDLSLPDMDVLERMQVEFGEAPEMLANFTISAPQIFGDGQSIGNIAPMNPDVPFASEDDDDYDDDDDDDDELDEEEEYEMLMRENEALQREEENERIVRAIRKDRGDEYYAESLEFNADPLDETTLEVPPAVVFVEKIPPTVWSNLTPESQMVYAETGDESVLICPQCGISKAQLRNQDGYCAVSDPEGMAYNASLDCPYQKHFAPAHWVDDEFVVGHVEGDFVEVATRLPADVDMPPMKGADTGVLTKMVPFYVWNRINQLVPAGITATPDATGLNYTLQYYGANQPLVENRIDVSEGDTDFMFGSERYHATILEAESGGYYINPQSLRIYGADNAEEDKGIYGDMFDYPIVYADLSADGRGYLIGYDDGGIWHTGIMFGGIEGNQDFIKEVAKKRLETHDFYQNRKQEETRPQTETTSDDDPDFDPEKADRNKDGEISDWERAVGNAVAKGIREHKESKGHMNFAETFEAKDNNSRREWTFLWKPASDGFGNSVYASSLEGAKKEVLRQYPQGSSMYGRADLSTLTDDATVNKRRWRDWDSQWNAETFGVEFGDWAEQEMLTHGRNVSFKDWAKREGKTHGNMELTDWAEHEEESHDERYGAESEDLKEQFMEVAYNEIFENVPHEVKWESGGYLHTYETYDELVNGISSGEITPQMMRDCIKQLGAEIFNTYGPRLCDEDCGEYVEKDYNTTCDACLEEVASYGAESIGKFEVQIKNDPEDIWETIGKFESLEDAEKLYFNDKYYDKVNFMQVVEIGGEEDGEDFIHQYQSFFADERYGAETFNAELEECYVCDGMFKQVYVCDNDCGFQCCEIDIDGNLIPVENADGTVKDYCITCYEEKYGAETFESPTTQDKIKPRTIATLLGAGALATILAPETIKKLFNRK
jgi:hypothetical protein|tara:strand:+ start:5149 stop:8550 length:3402 start_codon:yes stop_codon:yes gene_type:complete